MVINRSTMKSQRLMLSLFGFLLPLMAPIMGLFAYEKNGPTYWYSISATFYATSNIFMIGVLSIFAFFLLTYTGYDIGDNAICTFSAIMALGILIFPCNCAAAGETTGVFNLPTGISNIIHCIVAALLFGSFAFMIGLRFTKSNHTIMEGSLKWKRNRVYKTCAMIILTAMASQILTSLLGIGWMTIVNEAIMLWAFSFAWAVKANAFRILFADRNPIWGITE